MIWLIVQVLALQEQVAELEAQLAALKQEGILQCQAMASADAQNKAKVFNNPV